MSLLGNIFSNDTIKKAAFGSLHKIMRDGNYHMIVLTHNEKNQDSAIPGFDIQLFKEHMNIYPVDTVALMPEQYKQISVIVKERENFNSLTDDQKEAWSDPEVREIINRYLRAKKTDNGTIDTDTTSEPGSAGTEYDSATKWL